MRLLLNGSSLPVAQMGRDFILDSGPIPATPVRLARFRA